MSVPKFRRGLTFVQREKLRAHILETELERARKRAAHANVCTVCRAALTATGVEASDYVKLLHDQCRAEQPGGSGCLCPHLDQPGGDIVTGVIAEPF